MLPGTAQRPGPLPGTALGELVREDLSQLIDRLYPEGLQLDRLDREAAEHEAFARSRTGVYIGREDYFRAMDKHASGDGPPLVVLGESGSGKSALLANWAISWRTRHPGELVMMHFTGASPHSTDWAAMLQRIIAEAHRRSSIEQEIPDKPEELRVAFADCLNMVAARGRMVLALDALNQLEDSEGALDLAWLPSVIPANVRLIISTLPGRPLEELNTRSWPALRVEPLERKERQELITTYLHQYGKELSPERAERIVGAEQSANPLYVRALLATISQPYAE